MIEAALLLMQAHGDWRDAVRADDWRLVDDTPVRQVFVRETGRLEVREETDGGSVFLVWNLDCATKQAQAPVVVRYDRNNLEGAAAPSPPGVFPMPTGPGSAFEAVAAAVCPTPD